jgi:hypothetical protein
MAVHRRQLAPNDTLRIEWPAGVQNWPLVSPHVRPPPSPAPTCENAPVALYES